MKIQQVKSEIEKHKDALNELKENQTFLLKLTPEQFFAEREQRVKAKKEKAFKEWIKRYREDKSQDDIIFRDDIDEIHEGIRIDTLEGLAFDKSSTTGGRTFQTASAGKKDKGKRQISRETVGNNEAWLSQRFEQLLHLDLIDLDDDFYEDELYFTDPDELDQKFAQLEEDNLFYIHQIQDIEQYLETTNDTVIKTRERLDKKISALHENKSTLEGKIGDAIANLEQQKKSSFGAQILDKDSLLRKQEEGKQPTYVDFENLLD